VIKPDFEQPIDSKTYIKTIGIFEKLMKIAHPFMPFITEEVYQQLSERKKGDSIMVSPWPAAEEFDDGIIKKANKVFEAVGLIRNIRQQNGISPKEKLKLYIKTDNIEMYYPATKMIWKLANIEDFDIVVKKIDNAISFHVGADEWYIPIDKEIDVEKEIVIIEEEIKYLQGFLKSVMKKLGNERFVQNAPEKVVLMEKKKQEDGEKRISALKEKLENLKSMK